MYYLIDNTKMHHHYKLIVIGDEPEKQLESFSKSLNTMTSREATAEEIGGIIIYAYEDGDCNVDYQSSLRDIFKAVGDDYDGGVYSMLGDTTVMRTNIDKPERKWNLYVIGGEYKDAIINKNGEKVDSAIKGEIKDINMDCFALLVNKQWFDRDAFGDNFDKIKEAMYVLASDNERITIVDCHT